MSHIATNWAFEMPERFPDMKPGEWAVLMVLANCHNPVQGCFPSQDYICSRTNLSERAVRDQLCRLRDRGLIDWDASRDDGRRGANRYSLGFESDFQPANSAGSSTGKTEQELPADSDTTNRQNLPPNLVREPVIEPERERGRATGQAEHPGKAGADGDGAGGGEPSQPGEAPRPTRAELLEADWLALKAVWPDMALQAHGAARAKLAELKAAERRAAIEAVPAFIAFHREKRGKRPLPYLVNYLGERRWEDLPKRPAGGGEGEAPAPVGAYDRAWWRLFFDWLARHGSAVGDLGGAPGQWLARKCSAARSGMPWIIQRGELADIEERALRLVQVPLLGREADAWRAHLRTAFGIDLPKPDRAEWIWVPSADPAGWGEGTSGEDVA